jgi:DNA-directed RNA polymerase subunit RPC12/RpoP
MSIMFHCEHCGKKVEAPDTAGGKWGKCPACHNKVYIPSLQADEEIRLAPLDKEEERKRRELFNETVRLRQDILSETDLPPEEGTLTKNQAAKPGVLSDAELMTTIIAYLRQMADGELDEAGRTAKAVLPNGVRAIKFLERIALSEIPEPELADIPQNVLARLIKTLRNQLH